MNGGAGQADGQRIEGRLRIRVAPPDGAVRIESTRPLLAARLFEGRTVRETLNAMPLVFNICGQSQAIAAVRAVESAQGRPAAGQVERARDLLKRLETLREHLWRVLLEWPGFYAGANENRLLAQMIESLQTLRSLLDPERVLLSAPGVQRTDVRPSGFQDRLKELQERIARDLFGFDVEAWLAFDVEALFDWSERARTPAARLLHWVRRQGWEALGPSDVEPLPALPEDALLSRLDAADGDAFVAAPDWQGEPRETGPAARWRRHPLLAGIERQYGNGLLLRLVARLVEIAATTLELAAGGPDEEHRAGSAGLCQLEAARGRLCHRVVLDGERFERYRILAPTEWNFHPCGTAARALAGINDQDATRVDAQARLLIHAVDPCVGYELQVGAD